MKGLGHFPMSEDPPKFIDYLLPVLEKIRGNDSRRHARAHPSPAGGGVGRSRGPRVSSATKYGVRHVPRRSRPHPAARRRRDRRAGREFTGALRYDALPEEARHYARRHLLDTVGVMIAGAPGTIATQAETVITAVRPAGKIPVPGRARRADLLDAAFLGGTAAHGIELDDGYRHGSAHCGCVIVPAVLARRLRPPRLAAAR